MNILVVDDEREIADVIELYLQNDQYSVFKFYTGEDAMDCIRSKKIDLAILDIMLPDIDGFQLLKMIREKYTFPVIMLTAKTEYMDKITGLTLGADDYIPKPFDPAELVARVKAHLSRYARLTGGGQGEPEVLDLGRVQILPRSWRVLKDGQEISLEGMTCRVIATPGHTAGGCCYYFEEAGILLAGDTLFAESVGRTDFPTGSMGTLVRSIKEKLFTLPEDTRVYPGHGESTTIGHEKKCNPFCV